KGKFLINLLGEYNIAGDAFLIEDLFQRCGLTLISTFSGNSSIEQFANCHTADLNLVMCHRSINYVADMLEKKFGIPWIKINFIGAKSSAESLRAIAKYFGDKGLSDQVEKVIAEEMPAVEAAREEVMPRTKGKLAMIFVGGSRAHHYQELFAEIGMSTIAAGYEFAHRDDYEGRKVLADLKVDADSRNIEELVVEKDSKRYNQRKTQQELKKLGKAGVKVQSYDGMMPEMVHESFVIDDISQYETEMLIEKYKPAVFCAGIKEKYTVQKRGVPMKQLHSYDYGGPFAVFKGAVNFYKEMDRTINSRVWGLINAPWDSSPKITATFILE
ncbi:MAG: nitrogenase molybdenum-iron protein alpha chain, partial [Candidatus Omnitrophica bacterium]|nr:nitrogenase molybdenum-iron protein alpha chain [Candidatus Omnitrophota bacterium]